MSYPPEEVSWRETAFRLFYTWARRHGIPARGSDVALLEDDTGKVATWKAANGATVLSMDSGGSMSLTANLTVGGDLTVTGVGEKPSNNPTYNPMLNPELLVNTMDAARLAAISAGSSRIWGYYSSSSTSAFAKARLVPYASSEYDSSIGHPSIAFLSGAITDGDYIKLHTYGISSSFPSNYCASGSRLSVLNITPCFSTGHTLPTQAYQVWSPFKMIGNDASDPDTLWDLAGAGWGLQLRPSAQHRAEFRLIGVGKDGMVLGDWSTYKLWCPNGQTPLKFIFEETVVSSTETALRVYCYSRSTATVGHSFSSVLFSIPTISVDKTGLTHKAIMNPQILCTSKSTTPWNGSIILGDWVLF